MAVRQAFDANFELLHRSLNPSSKLFIKLRSISAIATHLPSIKQLPTPHEKNVALLDALLDVPDDLREQVMNEFIAVLRSTGQDHVANIFRPESDEVPMSDEHYKLLTDKRSSLSQFIKPNDGLADHLVASGALSEADRTAILSKPQIDDMAEELINILLRKSESAFDQFVNALNETNQSHVAYFLTGEGPTPMTDHHRNSLLRKMDELCKFVDVENGLLDRLISQEVVSFDEGERIRSAANDSDMVRTLVSTLRKKNDAAFDGFVNALSETGQEHVRYILTGEGDCRPLKNEHRKTLLSKNRDHIIEMISSKNSNFVATLMSKGVFSKNDEERVVSARDTNSRNEIILNLVAKKSQSAFSNFISALNDTDQTHVVVSLIGVDVFVKMKALYDNGGITGDYAIPNVDAELLQYVREMFESNGTVVTRLNDILSPNGVAVTDVKEGCIQVTFTCKTLESLKYFQQLCRSGTLITLLNEAFCPKFADKGLQSLAVEIPDEQFDNCEKTLTCWAPMTSQHREALMSSAECLVEKMTVNDDLLDKLTLCRRRREALETTTAREQVKTLLDTVSRRPDFAFTELIKALNCTGQSESAEMLLASTKEVPVKPECQSPIGHKALKRTSDIREIEMEQEKKRPRMEKKVATFKDLIRYNFPRLLRCMDPSNELLGELMSLEFVSDRLSVINQQSTVDDRTNALLTALLQIPDECQESAMNTFVDALRNSGQDHVADIFCPKFDKVPMSNEHREILVKHRYQLCQFLDPENGLLDRLVSSGIISSIDDRRIRSKNMPDALVRELIDTILKKSDDAFEALMQALNDTGQSHVTHILSGRGSSLPLSEPLIYELIFHRHHMVNAMEAKKSGLVSALMTRAVFSQYDEQRVKNKYREDGVVINETILDLLMRKSQSSFYAFIEALKDTHQEEVAAVLQRDMKSVTPTSAKPKLLKGLSTTDSSLPIMVEGTDAPDMFKPAETGLFLKEGKYSPM